MQDANSFCGLEFWNIGGRMHFDHTSLFSTVKWSLAFAFIGWLRKEMPFFFPALSLLSHSLSFSHHDLCGFIDHCGLSPCNLHAVQERKVMDRWSRS